jgi:beta-lactamase superfamily II metal-dependent hydrolase
MVDTGDADSALDVVDTLNDLGVSGIDKMIITHFDQDHVGGAAEVLSNFKVGEVLTTYQSKSSEEIDAYEQALQETSTPARTLTADETITVQNLVLDIIVPRQTSYEEDTSNNSSLVTRLTYGSTRMLLTGDIQQERIEELLSEGTDLTADLLKMPHHGAVEENMSELIDACGARYAVICCSNKNPEDELVCDLLEESGAEVFLTRKGEVIATTDGSVLSVTQE